MEEAQSHYLLQLPDDLHLPKPLEQEPSPVPFLAHVLGWTSGRFLGGRRASSVDQMAVASPTYQSHRLALVEHMAVAA